MHKRRVSRAQRSCVNPHLSLNCHQCLRVTMRGTRSSAEGFAPEPRRPAGGRGRAGGRGGCLTRLPRPPAGLPRPCSTCCSTGTSSCGCRSRRLPRKPSNWRRSKRYRRPRSPAATGGSEVGRAGPAKLSSETEPRASLSLGWLGTTLLVAWPARHCGELETEGVLVVISWEP